MKWKETIFDNVLRLNRGFDLPNQAIEEGPYPVVASTSIKAYHKAFKVEGPGVVTGRSGSLGDVQYLPGRFWPLNTSLYVKDFKGNNERFIAYFLQTMRLENFNSGAGVPTLNQNHLHKLSVKIPPFPTQRKIAAILTAYDDLIETNKRRIALLEKMAEELYREWFVRMRFPGHQNTRFVKGVPEGWSVRELRECADVNPSCLGRNDRPDIIHYVDIGSVTTNQIGDIQSLPFAEAPGRAKRKVQHGDIIWSSVRPANRAYCLIYKPIENLIVSTGFAVIRPKSITPFTFLDFVVTGAGFVDQMTVVAKGAAYPATSFDDFERAKLLWPGEELLTTFHDNCEPMFHQKFVLTEQNRVLTKTRDLLLPRLISGKLSVENLDIQFPPGMQEESPEPVSPYG
jgi:type I restriction enzyme S subunit